MITIGHNKVLISIMRYLSYIELSRIYIFVHFCVFVGFIALSIKENFKFVKHIAMT